MRVSFVCIVLYSHLSPALLFFLILISGIFFFPISLENRPLKARYQRWLNLRKNFHFWSNSQKKRVITILNFFSGWNQKWKYFLILSHLQKEQHWPPPKNFAVENDTFCLNSTTTFLISLIKNAWIRLPENYFKYAKNMNLGIRWAKSVTTTFFYTQCGSWHKDFSRGAFITFKVIRKIWGCTL